MTYYKRTPQSPEQFLHWKVKDLERRVSNIEGGKVLSAPLYDWNNLPQDSVEGQVAILDNIPSAYGKAVLPRNVTELDQVRGATTLGTSYVLNWRWNEINIGDGILVMAWAPSKYQVGAALGTPTTVTDSKGNTYTPLVQRKFEDATPLVNTGGVARFFWCPSTVSNMVAGVDTITANWSNPVYDRMVYALQVRHDGGTHTPTVLAAHADNDTTTYASSQVVLTCPAWTPARVNAFNIAFTLYNSPTGIASWGGASGYTGYFNANARNIFWDSGSPHQDYRCFHLIHGCDLYQAITATDQIAYDLGFLTPVLQASFNGPGLNFGAGPNQWKGIVLLGFD